LADNKHSGNELSESCWGTHTSRSSSSSYKLLQLLRGPVQWQQS